MSEIIKSANDAGFRARADRRITQGIVVSKDEATHTCILDVGAYDANDSPVYLHDISYQPQTPPQVNDTVSLMYSNVSPHSIQVAGGQVGGGNTGQKIEVSGAVSSLRKTGETSGQQGDITLDPGANITITHTGSAFSFAVSSVVTSLNGLPGDVTLQAGSNVTLTQAGNTITIASAAGGGSPSLTAPPAIANANALGTDTTHYALSDHTHQGVHLLNSLAGEVTLQAGSNITITPSGQNLIIAASGGTGSAGVSSVNTLTGALTLAAGANVTLTQAGSTITIAASSAGVSQAARVALDHNVAVVDNDTASQLIYLVLTADAGFTDNLEFGATITPTNNTDHPGVVTQNIFHVLNATSQVVNVSNVSSSITLVNVASTIAIGASATYVCVRTAPNTYSVYQF